MTLVKKSSYLKSERKFFKKHKNLINTYSTILKSLKEDPFNPSLNTHKIKDFYVYNLNKVNLYKDKE